jgi:DNA-directed RNA polymerase subunit M/transcription elongation factor TFIIS
MQRTGFISRKCPKCGGSLYLDYDTYGWYEQCLQCGHISDLKELTEVKNISKDTAAQPEEVAATK